MTSRYRRADARRRRDAILDAAVDLLSADPECGLEAVAAAAGVTRQTVYAHYPSREHLLAAVLDRVTGSAVAALNALDLDTGPPAEALLDLLAESARITAEHRPLFRLAAMRPASTADDRWQHAPAVERLERLIRRGQAAGEFDAGLTPGWLAAAVVRLGHAAGDEVEAGTMAPAEAAAALRVSVLRLLGAPIGGPRPSSQS